MPSQQLLIPTATPGTAEPQPPLTQLAIAARLTLTPLFWETLEAALNPLLPEPPEITDALRTRLTLN